MRLTTSGIVMVGPTGASVVVVGADCFVVVTGSTVSQVGLPRRPISKPVWNGN